MTSTTPMSPEPTTPDPPAAAARPGTYRMKRREILRALPGLSGRDPLQGLADLPGTSSLVKIPSPGRATFLVRHPDHARQVLISEQDDFVKGDDYKILAVVLGQGLLTNADRESWQRNRALVQPLFARRHLAPMGDAMVAAAGTWLDAIGERHRDGDQLEVNAAMMGLTLDVVGRALFGRSIDGPTTRTVGSAMTKLLDAGGAAFDLVPVFTFLNDHTPLEFDAMMRVRWIHWRRVVASKKQMDDVVHGIIDARLADGAATGDDLLSLLLAARDEHGGGALDREQVRDEVMTFLGAGHETTANALTWTWMLLSQHPEARRRMEAEVDEVLAGARPTLADAERLPWTNAVINESMRLYPPVPAITRVARVDTTMEGVRVRAGSTMIILPYLLHRDPEFWPNPEGFDPERWLTTSPASRPRQSFMPFGAGRRICVGQEFARIESVLLAAMTVQRLRLDLAPGARIGRHVTVTLRPAFGMPMHYSRRTDAPAVAGA